jgi:uncharacterized repeat protein (TIGR01451 family)
MFTTAHREWGSRVLRLLTPLLLFLLLLPAESSAQSPISLSLTKSADATTLPSGQQFTYTLSYSWSGGAPGTIIIRDTVPSTLTVVSTLPAATVTGNIVEFQLTGLTASAAAGTVQINVKFPPGTTCNGARACNTAWISMPNGAAVSSGQPVCVSATAQNKWTMEKSLFAGCAIDDIVIYRVCVTNPSGGDIGGLNLTNVQVKDIVPVGATLIGVTGWWTGGTVSGTTITLTGGPTTLGVSMYPMSYCAYISIKYPSTSGFTVGQTLVDTAKVQWTTPCDTLKPGLFLDTAKVVLCAANPSGQLSKWLSINAYFPMGNPYYYPSFSPGCCGTYTLWYSNTGNVSQPGFVMEDNVPSTLDVTSIVTNAFAPNAPVTVDVFCWSGGTCSATPCTTATYSAGTYTMTSLPANVCKVRWTYSGSVAPAAYLYNQLNVCVRSASYAPPFTPVTTGQNILNTVTAQATNLSLITASVTKPVDSLRPKILATKVFMGSGCSSGCQPQTAGPFVPGSIVRWRMAVTNVGNTNATSLSITDALPSGFSYVGNPTYWYGPSSWMAGVYTPPCCSLSTSVPSQIGGTISTPSVGDTTLTWTFPTLPYRCDGTVEYFVIEFDVLVGTNPPVPPGQYFNNFTITAANHPAVTSNNAQVTINAIAQLTLLKEVRPKTGSAAFSSTALVPAGAQAEFRLRLKNTGNLTLSNICLFDVMPHVGDINVIGTTPVYPLRSSQFDLAVASAASVVAPGSYTIGYNSSANTKNPQRTTVCGGFCGGIVDPTNGAGPLTGGIFGAFGGSTYSFTVSGGPTQLLPGGTLDVFVTSTVPSTATPGQTACNSFAVQAKPVATTQCLQTEAVPACVRVAEHQTPAGCDKFWLEGKPDDCCGYSFIMSNAGGAAVQSLQYNVLPIAPSNTPSGTIQGITTTPCAPTSTVPPSLSGTTSGMLNFNTACTGASPTSVNISASSNTASGEICIELIAVILRNGQTVDCKDTICFRCDRSSLTRCDSMSVKPFPFVDLDLSGRTFTIYNLKSPASPICSVKVVVAPPPSGPGVNGGGLYIDGIWKPWPFGSSSGYTQILPVHGMPANNTVQWNLGIDYTIGWVGTVTATAYHCDGDSCTMTYGPWKATKKDIISVGTGVDIPEKAKLRVHRLSFSRDKALAKDIRAIAIRHRDPVETIVAVTGAALPCDTSSDCDDDIIERVSETGRTVFAELSHALEKGKGGRDLELTVLYTASVDRRPTVEILYYDGTGNEVGHDTVTVTGSALGVDDDEAITGVLGALSARPNPTTGRVELGFTLATASTVDLELVDALGKRVMTVLSAERLPAGQHSYPIDMSEMASGVYMAALNVNGVPTVVRLELVR